MQTVFVVEDDADIRELVIYALGSSGFAAEGFDTGEGLFARLPKKTPDIILLDIMLPGKDGIAILKQLRSDRLYKLLPVIMLTAKSGEYDKVKGLDTGADDYVTKPFGITELISRIRAVLRRSARGVTDAKEPLVYEDLTLDVEAHTVAVRGEAVTLTLKEYELLRCLLVNKGLVLSRDRLMDTVWGIDFEGQTRTVDMHIKTLRQKLKSAGEYIKTVRGVGYKIDV